MSVYTSLSNKELSDFLLTYEIGELADYKGISEGIENTNYFVNTIANDTVHQFVLTVFESVGFEELPYFLELTAFLAEHGLPCAHPVANKEGHYLQKLKRKPIAIVQRLAGKGIKHPEPSHCQQAGEALASLHLVGREFPLRRKNPRGLDWAQQAAERVEHKLSNADLEMLEQELEYQSRAKTNHLPGGVIHADLFRDNTLFNDDRLSGIIDFYYACDGSFLYDLAITANDWCSNSKGVLNRDLLEALLNGYQSQRKLSDDELRLWPTMLRAAALRFWLSRLIDMHFPRPGDLTHTHDPLVFRNILEDRINTHTYYEKHWV